MKALIKKTPLYPVLRAIKERRELAAWERQGKPIPPPYVVKKRVLREFAQRFGLKILVETGTYRGDMVEAMTGHFARIYSIELSAALHERARKKFAGDDRITLVHGDSGVELKRVVAELDQAALFWLDGHYCGDGSARGTSDTPIYDELSHILGSPQPGHVIIIDDARCFGTDPAYPTVGALREFVRARRPDAEFIVENDSMRIIHR